MKPEIKQQSCAPAPGSYDPEKADKVLHPAIQHTFGLKPEIKQQSCAPAPGSYDPEKADKVLHPTCLLYTSDAADE